MTESEKKAYTKESDPFVVRGDYKKALAVLKPWLKKYPEDFYLQYQYAKLLGDWADELPSARKKKYKQESIAILEPLMKRLRGQPLSVRFRLPLNFYYQSEDWQGMYAFGRRFSKLNRRDGLYAQGLAATYLGETSSLWAKRAVTAWGGMSFAKEKYYFPHYVYAKALALNGDTSGAMKRLKIAARLGKRPVTDWEFADVLKLCSQESA